MKDQSEQLYLRYLKETERTGKTIKHVKYGVKIFNHYLSEVDLQPLMIKIRDAQDFQVYLTTSTTENGTIRFTRASVLNIVGSISNFYEFIYSNY